MSKEQDYAKKLLEWLINNHKTQRYLADNLPSSEAMVSYIVTGRHRPSFRMAMRVQELTDGYVRADLLYSTDVPIVE